MGDEYNNSYSEAYIAYDAWSNEHRIQIEQLNENFTDVLQPSRGSGEISKSGNEAPIFFRRGSSYYLLYGHTCCFCANGANAEVWTASHPLGPWNNTGIDINPSGKKSVLH